MNKIRQRSRSQDKKTQIQPQNVIDLDNPQPYTKGYVLAQRYQCERLIAEGSFGRVILAKDLNTQYLRAIKILKDPEESSNLEYHFVKKLLQHPYHTQHPGRRCIVKAYECFYHNEHPVIVFELLGMSLYSYMEKYRCSFTLKQIQIILKDCLLALDYMHKLNMAHTDIKPENIVFRNKKEFNVKLIDFGNVVMAEHPRKGLINTRQYRAPEVILEMNWSKSSDIWSLGCVIYELQTGSVLFNPEKDDHAHLAMIQRISGSFPPHMRTNIKFFENCDRLRWPLNHHSKRLQEKVGLVGNIVTKCEALNDILALMLVIDPSRRATASDLMRHRFLFQQL